MSEACNHDCSSCGSNCKDRTAPQSFRVAPHPTTHVKKVIGVVSGKGGVGKSLVTSLLACSAARRGKAAGILDADITGPSIPKAFGITGRAEGSQEGISPPGAPRASASCPSTCFWKTPATPWSGGAR